jgi:uncharacterized protein YggE
MAKVESRIAIILALVMSMARPALAQEMQGRRQITVDGDAEVKVVPDQVVITLAVETVDKSLPDAKKANDKLVESFTGIARGYGVLPGDIQTDYLTIEPKYETRDRVQEFQGHDMRRRLVITLNNISKFDDLLTSLVSAGANNVQDVRFMTKDLRKYKDQARSMAVTAASEKAQALASQLGAKVGKPFSIQERSSRWYSGYGRWYGYKREPNPFNASQNAGDAPPPGETSTAVGKISVTASVSVTFDLE